MSKETILAKIQSNLAGQGSMIDISGKLPEVLAEIIDLIPEGGGGVEPYFVQDGVINGNDYKNTVIVVSEDEYARAKAAFLAGRPVIVPEIDSMAYSVVGYSLGATAREPVDPDDPETPVEGLVLYNSDAGNVSAEGVAIAIVVPL